MFVLSSYVAYMFVLYFTGKEDSQRFISELNKKLTEEHRQILKVSKIHHTNSTKMNKFLNLFFSKVQIFVYSGKVLTNV